MRMDRYRYERQAWQTVRQRGKRWYVRTYGVLLFGTVMVLTLVMIDLRHRWNEGPSAAWGMVASFLVDFVLGLLCGLLFGHVMWAINERKYQRGE
ncbi:MAG TPA: hypothetical protein VF669_20135 [Tepidisphaeraceae bacterium]